MKLNWGWGIALFYGLFAIAMVSMAIRSMHYDHSLVREDYYQADLEYQQQYDKLVNQYDGMLAIHHTVSTPSLLLKTNRTPEANVSGTVLFFRPDNQALDFEVPVVLDENGQQTLPLESLARGRWKVQVDYQVGETPFYTETEIFY